MTCALILVGSPVAANAMQNEPEEFLGIEWGAPIEKYRGDLKPMKEDGDSGYYRRVSDRPFFAGIEVRRISYYFYKGNFTSGTYTTIGVRDLKSILSYLAGHYGEPKETHPTFRVYIWEGKRSGVIVSCDVSISCYTEFFDKALREQALTARGEFEEDN